MNKACFLDRDGVIIEEVNYLRLPEQVRIFRETFEALRILKSAGFLPIVVSNQSGIARGYFTEPDLLAVEKHIRFLLSQENLDIAHWYYCPHLPDAVIEKYRFDCQCRKPAPGMFSEAVSNLDIDLAASAMIGDKFSDLDAAVSAGCLLNILVRTGHGNEELEKYPDRVNDFPVVSHILDAAEIIVKRTDT